MAKLVITINTGDVNISTGMDAEDALRSLSFERYTSVDGICGCIRGIGGVVVGSWGVK